MSKGALLCIGQVIPVKPRGVKRELLEIAHSLFTGGEGRGRGSSGEGRVASGEGTGLPPLDTRPSPLAPRPSGLAIPPRWAIVWQ